MSCPSAMSKVICSLHPACSNFITYENEENKGSNFKINYYTIITTIIANPYSAFVFGVTSVIFVIKKKNTVIPQQVLVFTIGY